MKYLYYVRYLIPDTLSIMERYYCKKCKIIVLARDFNAHFFDCDVVSHMVVYDDKKRISKR